MADDERRFSTMLRSALGSRLAPAMGYVEMLADEAVMEFPFAPPGWPRQLRGRRAIVEYLGVLSTRLSFDRMGSATVLESRDPEVVVIEFAASGHGLSTDEAYDQRYISVIRTRGGRIVHYRDYWNPLVMLRALKGRSIEQAITVQDMDGV